MKTVEGYDLPLCSNGIDSKMREWIRSKAKAKEDWIHKVLPELMPKHEIDLAIEKFDPKPIQKYGILILVIEYTEHPFDAVTILQNNEIKFSKLFPR